MNYSPLQIREVFHLLFLQEFLRKFDPKLVVLKGGVNLRFFFKSPRYSEDMDFDVKTASLQSLKNNVLRSLKALSRPMNVYGVSEIVAPAMKSAKQTETTQRFKIHLHTSSGLDLFTKIEFSRRGLSEGFRFEKVTDQVLRHYQLGPVLVQHYESEAAFVQKVQALAGRVEVQSRDVFDLYQLLSFLPDSGSMALKKKLKRKLCQQAAQRAEEISFKEYREAVVAYLSEADQNIYGLEEVWEQMKNRVSQSLINLVGPKE